MDPEILPFTQDDPPQPPQETARPILGLILLLALVWHIPACGTNYRLGKTPAGLVLQYRSSSYRQFPMTIPVKSGETVTLRAGLKRPLSNLYRLQSKAWQWTINGSSRVVSTKNELHYDVSDASHSLQLTCTLHWTKKQPHQTQYIMQKLQATVHLALAIERSPGQTRIHNYSVGTYPGMREEYTWYNGQFVIIEPSNFYSTPGSKTRLGRFRKGQQVRPTDRGLTTVQERISVRFDNRTVWIPPRAITLPPSIRYHPTLYEPPRIYYPVTETNEKGFVLPFLRWNQFNHDKYYRDRVQPPYPHYIPIRDILLVKLRGLQTMLTRHGHSQRITLISGLRNPKYNQREFNNEQTLKALYSRHQYGDAVDLIVDGSMSRRMDDLNDDGRVDIEDARVVAGLMDSWNRTHHQPGGIGIYAFHDVKRRRQTPYVHIDARGFRARWTVP